MIKATTNQFTNVFYESFAQQAFLPLRVVAAAAMGYFSWLDPALLPVLILFSYLVVYTPSLFATWLSASAYYLIASADMPASFGTFFPEHNVFIGYFLWFLSAGIIALPWLFVRWLADTRPFNRSGNLRFGLASLLGMFVSLLPPISFIHWVHPGLIAGIFFPGWEIWGLIITFVLISFFPLVLKSSKPWLFLGSTMLLAVLITYGNRTYQPSIPSSLETYAVKTTDGKFLPSEGYHRIKKVQDISELAIDFKRPFVLFPETYLGVERSSIQSILGQNEDEMKRAGVTLLVGMESKSGDELFDNALVGFGAVKGVVYKARMPMPLNMLPGIYPQQQSHFTESPVVRVGEQNIFFSICYESFLLEHAVAAMLSEKKPDIMLAASNLWAFKDLRVAKIQGLSIQLIARMMGVPVEWSYNV